MELTGYDLPPWGLPKPWHAALDAGRIVAYGRTRLIGDGPDSRYLKEVTVAVADPAGLPTELESRTGDVVRITYVTEAAPRAV
jgi:hypothetical protein